ncbi:MAG: hypothetical protein MUP63_03355 [Candidatus Nanohaloarchaeota archaeon QJJ-7]|nr:hypothetical protein [Candidatus Nanohaloarchaeota archaeon QJJ-7]
MAQDIPHLGKGWNEPQDTIEELLGSGEDLPEWAETADEVLEYAEETWPTDESDLERLEIESRRSEWGYCSECGKEYETRGFVNEKASEYRQDADTRVTSTLVIYCPEHGDSGEYFSIYSSWHE